MTAVTPRGDDVRARLAAFLDLPVAVGVFDTELRFVAINDALAADNGLPRDEHLGRYAPDLLPGIDPAAWSAMRRVIETGRPETLLVRGATAARGEGGAWQEEFHPWVDPVTGTVLGVVATAIDVTDELAAEEAARRRAEQLNGLALLGAELVGVDAEADVAEMLCRHAVVLLDAAAGAVAVGPLEGPIRVIAAVGYPGGPDEASRRLPDASALADTARTGRPHTFVDGPEWEATFPAGAAYHREAGLGSIATAPLLSVDEMVGAIAVSHREPRTFTPDERSTLTALASIGGQALERVRAAEERRRTAQLREAFIDVMAHELKTPLSTIYGGLQTVARHTNLAPETRDELIRDATAEAHRLVRLVDDLVVLSRLERGVDVDLTEPLLLSHLAERVIDSKAINLGADIVLVVPPDLPAVRGEVAYVEQVLRNLITNALKYGAPPYEVRITPTDDDVEVRVLDRGPGVPADAEKLFMLYYREASVAARAAGSGIGLFVCRELVALMGGRTWASNRPGGGAEFGFSLPVWREDAES